MVKFAAPKSLKKSVSEEQGGNYGKAIEFIARLYDDYKDNYIVNLRLGWLYYLKGSYLNAIAELQDSLALEPDNPVINYHMGMAYFKNGQTDTAKQFLEKALKIDQNFNEAENALRILEEIDALP